MGVLKRIAAEFNYRRGRRRRDAGRLSRATEQDRYAFRAALELSRMGDPGPVLDLLMVALASLRDSGDSTPVTPGVHAFLDHVLNHLHATHSQSFQDLAAHFVCGGKRNGTFVEVGTGNGRTLSNTYFLEREAGWSGVLFEPDRRFHESIAKTRGAKLDTRAAFRESGRNLDFLEVGRAGELSTLDANRNSDGRRRTGAVRPVQTVALSEAFDEHGLPAEIDYVSIDTEGSELDVLQGIDFTRHQVRFLTVEHNFVAPHRAAIVSRLEGHGYHTIFPSLSGQDVWMVRGDTPGVETWR